VQITRTNLDTSNSYIAFKDFIEFGVLHMGKLQTQTSGNAQVNYGIETVTIGGQCCDSYVCCTEEKCSQWFTFSWSIYTCVCINYGVEVACFEASWDLPVVHVQIPEDMEIEIDGLSGQHSEFPNLGNLGEYGGLYENNGIHLVQQGNDYYFFLCNTYCTPSQTFDYYCSRYGDHQCTTIPTPDLAVPSVTPYEEDNYVYLNMEWIDYYPGNFHQCGILYSIGPHLKSFDVTFTPDTIEYSETATITVQGKDDDNNNIDPKADDTWLLFELDPTSARLGHLSGYNNIDGVTYGYAKAGGVKFVADGEEPDGVETVKVKVQNGDNLAIEGEGVLVVKRKPEMEILLGQTKYVRVKEDPNNDTSLIFEEFADLPQTSGLDPIMVVTKVSGDKLGVYYEYKDNQCEDLPNGVIRLIGRYWKEGVTYIARLTATTGERTGSLKILVKKPSKLGNNYGKSRDVFDNEYNVDDLICKYAGKYGIPPQMIKGQMAIESPTKNFGAYTGFAPAYRYEPFTTEFFIKDIKKKYRSLIWPNSPFKVTSTSMGTGDPVPDHQHTKYISYPTSPKTIWWMVTQYSRLVDLSPQGNINLYCGREADGKLNFVDPYGYKEMQKIYNGVLKGIQGNKPDPSSEDIEKARIKMIEHLRDHWNDGLKSHYAQTRIASSYGLLQILYTKAIDRGYKLDAQHLPEDLNENEIFFPLSMKFHKGNLKEVLGESVEEGNDWIMGYEDAFVEMFKRYNEKSDYVDKIMTDSQKYLPKN